jgi:hypothetical protein
VRQEGGEIVDEQIDDTESVLRAAVFRSVPHSLKIRLYDRGHWMIPSPWSARTADPSVDSNIWRDTRHDIRILRWLAEESVAADVGPTFQMFHFFGVHHPSSIGHDCSWSGQENPAYKDRDRTAYRSRDTAIQASSCMLRLVVGFFDKLIELGIYDSSLIFVIGDHGRYKTTVDISYAVPPIPVTTPAKDEASIGTKQFRERPTKGPPLFLVKRIGDREPLRVSDEPVSLCDIPRTILSELDIEGSYQCESIFEMGGSRKTPRLHFRRDTCPTKGRCSEIPFVRFVVDGHSWLESSWQRTK